MGPWLGRERFLSVLARWQPQGCCLRIKQSRLRRLGAQTTLPGVSRKLDRDSLARLVEER